MISDYSYLSFQSCSMVVCIIQCYCRFWNWSAPREYISVRLFMASHKSFNWLMVNHLTISCFNIDLWMWNYLQSIFWKGIIQKYISEEHKCFFCLLSFYYLVHVLLVNLIQEQNYWKYFFIKMKWSSTILRCYDEEIIFFLCVTGHHPRIVGGRYAFQGKNHSITLKIICNYENYE